MCVCVCVCVCVCIYIYIYIYIYISDIIDSCTLYPRFVVFFLKIWQFKFYSNSL